MAAPAAKHPGELRWEPRLLAVLILTLLVFGIAMVYGAASYQTKGGGLSIAMSQFSGALMGGLLLLTLWLAGGRLSEQHQAEPIRPRA